MDHDRLERVTRRLALEAGAAILAVRARADLGTRLKDDRSPVTEADLAADRIISGGLREAFPDVPLVTEEQAATHGDLGGRPFLIVDPLDGTKDFVQRRDGFTVNIAYVEDRRPIRGVVYAPASGRLFYTRADGATVEEAAPHDLDAPGALRPLRVAVPDNAALRVVASLNHRDAATDAWIAAYEVAQVKSAGSSLKFCLLAAGEADLYPRLGRTMEWDTAAGQAVLAGAGGLVLDLGTRAPLGYGKPGYENPHFVALAPGVDLQ